ncbi:MAG: sulfotransferase domain-containing protein [Hyphomicrobium sp.]|nr:sulfotransferase domain-containing protein [Hyphomicrobium sp.]
MMGRIVETLPASLDDLNAAALASKSGVLLVSHPRSGTHATIDLLRYNFPVLAPSKPLLAPLSSLYVSLDAVLIESATSASVRRVADGLARHRIPLVKTHWLDPDLANLKSRAPGIADWIANGTKLIYVVRDPARVLASTFIFEGLSTAASVAERDAWLSAKAFYLRRHVEQWADRPGVLVLKFEDIVAGPRAAVETFAQHLGLEAKSHASPLPPPTRKLVWNRLQRLQWRPRSTEILSLRPVPAYAELFDREARERAAADLRPLAERFGYAVP